VALPAVARRLDDLCSAGGVKKLMFFLQKKETDEMGYDEDSEDAQQESPNPEIPVRRKFSPSPLPPVWALGAVLVDFFGGLDGSECLGLCRIPHQMTAPASFFVRTITTPGRICTRESSNHPQELGASFVTGERIFIELMTSDRTLKASSEGSQ